MSGIRMLRPLPPTSTARARQRPAIPLAAFLSLALGCSQISPDEIAAQAYLDRIREPIRLLYSSPPMTDGGSLLFVFLDQDGDSLRFCSRVVSPIRTPARHPDIYLGGRAERAEDGIRVPWRGQAEHRLLGLLHRWKSSYSTEVPTNVLTAIRRLETGHW